MRADRLQLLAGRVALLGRLPPVRDRHVLVNVLPAACALQRDQLLLEPIRPRATELLERRQRGVLALPQLLCEHKVEDAAVHALLLGHLRAAEVVGRVDVRRHLLLLGPLHATEVVGRADVRRHLRRRGLLDVARLPGRPVAHRFALVAVRALDGELFGKYAQHALAVPLGRDHLLPLVRLDVAPRVHRVVPVCDERARVRRRVFLGKADSRDEPRRDARHALLLRAHRKGVCARARAAAARPQHNTRLSRNQKSQETETETETSCEEPDTLRSQFTR